MNPITVKPATRKPRTVRPRTIKRASASLAVAAISIGLLGACGGTSEATATQHVCSARADLHTAVDNVVTQLKSLNFGQAKDDLANVNKAFDDLRKSVNELASDQKKTLSPQVDALKEDLANLKNVSSLSELSAGWDKVTSQFQSISSEISGTLKCP